jgi:hypothetical protein
VTDEVVLAYVTIVCLGVFLLGSSHYIAEAVVMAVRAVYKGAKRLCKTEEGSKNRVADLKKNKK